MASSSRSSFHTSCQEALVAHMAPHFSITYEDRCVQWSTQTPLVYDTDWIVRTLCLRGGRFRRRIITAWAQASCAATAAAPHAHIFNRIYTCYTSLTDSVPHIHHTYTPYTYTHEHTEYFRGRGGRPGGRAKHERPTTRAVLIIEAGVDPHKVRLTT